MKKLTEREAASVGPRDLKTPGTVDWAWQTLNALRRNWHCKELSRQQFEGVLEELKQHKAWEIVPPGNPYGDLDAMLQAEIGETEHSGKATLAARPVEEGGVETLGEHGGKRSGAGRKNQEDKNAKYPLDSPPKSQGGTARERRVARLKRDYPAIAVRLADGEFKSVAAAERAAKGEDPHPPRKQKTVHQWLSHWWEKATKKERQAFLKEIAP